MGESNTQGTVLPEESLKASYLSLIKGAKRVLDTLASVWKYSVTALLLSLSAIGITAIVLFLTVPGKEFYFTEGVIFLAIAAWIFARNVTGTCSQCCTADIPHWKSVLTSFVKPDNTIDSQKDGQSVVENLMQVAIATGDWIRLIKRDVFSVLFWPMLAGVVFLLSVYQVDVVIARVAAVGFIVYLFALTTAIYYSVNWKFRNWQTKVAQFKGYATTAIDRL
jgi:hypothetical protein